MLTKCGVQGMIGCSIIRTSLTVALMVSLPSQISAFCALTARSPCICSHLRVALDLCPTARRLMLSSAPAGAWGSAPKPYAAAFSTSVASVRRTQETRLSPNSGVFQRSEPPEGAWHLGKVMVSEGTAPILHSFASKTEYRTSETPRCKQPESAGIRPSQTG